MEWKQTKLYTKWKKFTNKKFKPKKKKGKETHQTWKGKLEVYYSKTCTNLFWGNINPTKRRGTINKTKQQTRWKNKGNKGTSRCDNKLK